MLKVKTRARIKNYQNLIDHLAECLERFHGMTVDTVILSREEAIALYDDLNALSTSKPVQETDEEKLTRLSTAKIHAIAGPVSIEIEHFPHSEKHND